MRLKRELFPFLLMLFVLLPTGYYFAGSMVYNEVAKTNTDCWGNFDQNTPISSSVVTLNYLRNFFKLLNRIGVSYGFVQINSNKSHRFVTKNFSINIYLRSFLYSQLCLRRVPSCYTIVY